jgi:hypothetical protein
MIIALIILIGVIYMQRSEGFEDPVPEYCGSAGFGQSPGVIKVFKIKEKDTIRQYTESECAKIDGSKFTNGQCTVVKDGKTIYCSQACKGLNKIPSPPPEECLVDGKLVGITSKEFKINVGKMVTFPDNTFRFYTKKDCDTLNGTHNVSFLTQMSEADRKTFITNHGKGYGFCSGNGLDYSGMCYAEPPSIADVKNKITGLFS